MPKRTQRCEGCGRVEQCEVCGRFMRHMWFDASTEGNADDWQDYWECSQQAKHAAAYTAAPALPLHDSHRWVDMGMLGSACSACGVCSCHDFELAAQQCVPTGFFIVPSSNPRQGSTAASPPELESLND